MSFQIIYTIGYENASIEGLIATLKEAGITRLLDIRDSPYSRRPEFSREELCAELATYGIAYEHIRSLGNPPAGREAARSGHKAVYREIFLEHLGQAEVIKALNDLLQIASQEAVCLMCFEKSAQHCHRSMVTERLSAISGIQIQHLRIPARQPHPAQAAFEF